MCGIATRTTARLAPVVEVRQASEDEWSLVRAARLAALADAPDAFGSTLAAEQGRPEAEWRRRAASFVLARGGASGAVAGLAAGWEDPAEPGAVQLVSMWVAPGWRRRGVGGALVDAVVAEARRRGASEVRLWVTDTNGGARRLYERCGFVLTGATAPLPSNPALIEARMALVLR
jgi:ribosomal protein S18 acetylase RimI-like enzyme